MPVFESLSDKSLPYLMQLRGGQMRKSFSALFLIFVAMSVLAATGCPERSSIADIESNPSKFENKEISIAGTVKDSYGISVPGTNIRGGTYKIDDGTGSFWVVTTDSVPTKGTKIGVKGKIASGVNWNGRNYGLGMYESDRRIVKR